MATLTQPVNDSLLKLDVQPILDRKPDGIWSKAEGMRDQLYEALNVICNKENIEALVLKSSSSVHPVWVKFECWIRQTDPLLTERVSAIITIEPKPFHRYESEYTVEIDDRGKTKTYASLIHFDANLLSALVHYLLRRGSKPLLSDHQVRRFPWQLWKPKNKITALKVDWLSMLPMALGILGFITLGIGIGILFLIGAGIAYYKVSRRPVLVRSSGKPEVEPRNLIRVDSWQAIISGLGPDIELLRKRFLADMANPPIKGLRHRTERIWYWGLDGKEEREQIVLSFGRGLVYCQIYRYDDELYAGWDGHLNVGQWIEKTIVQGFDRQSQQLIRANTVVPGTQQVTEYDITDLSCVMEWMHAKLTKHLKELMEERKIDQEIDFKILRGERQNLTQAGKPDTVGKKVRGALKDLRRLG